MDSWLLLEKQLAAMARGAFSQVHLGKKCIHSGLGDLMPSIHPTLHEATFEEHSEVPADAETAVGPECKNVDSLGHLSMCSYNNTIL